jgi:simple sugar transport system permease protein
MSRTVFGFAARMAGGNARAAQLSGLPIGRLVLTGYFLAGAAAGLAGMIEVAAVHGRANASQYTVSICELRGATYGEERPY